MSASVDMARQVRLCALEAAILALLRQGQDEGFDGMTIEASADDGCVTIDLSYTHAGLPLMGHPL